MTNKELREIIEFEKKAVFLAFLRWNWIKTLDEYKRLFWYNIQKRKEAIEMCKKHYPILSFKNF